MYRLDDAIFEQWLPAPGSQLYNALLELAAATAEVNTLSAVVDDLQERRAPEAMIATARRELVAAEVKLRTATKEEETLSASLAATITNVQHFEDIKAHARIFTAGEELQLNGFRDALLQLSGAG